MRVSFPPLLDSRPLLTEMMMWGQFPSLAITFRRSIVSTLPTMSESVLGRCWEGTRRC